ncbi:MAG: M42 family metallopeptidase [Clostridiaceae bacterium]
MENYIDYITENIVNLLNVPSPTGNTTRAINYIEKVMNELGVEYRVTIKGALIASIEGKDNSKERTIATHIDTLGAMVKGLKPNGKLAFDTIGRYTMNSIEGENCIIETAEGKEYTGTIQSIKPSVHIHNDVKELERKLENMEIVIDERVENPGDVEKLGISVGDFVFLESRTRVTKSGFIKSRHLDDKASAGIVLGVIKYIRDNNIIPGYKTNFFFSPYEEVGHGASASIPENTFEFLAVDMGAPGEGQNSSEYSVCICAKDSTGPYDYSFRNELTNLCKSGNINYRVDLYPFYTSDASAVLRAGCDCKAGLIGAGIFASHAYERTHKDGIINTAKLLKDYIKS